LRLEAGGWRLEAGEKKKNISEAEGAS